MWRPVTVVCIAAVLIRISLLLLLLLTAECSRRWPIATDDLRLSPQAISLLHRIPDSVVALSVIATGDTAAGLQRSAHVQSPRRRPSADRSVKAALRRMD